MFYIIIIISSNGCKPKRRSTRVTWIIWVRWRQKWKTLCLTKPWRKQNQIWSGVSLIISQKTTKKAVRYSKIWWKSKNYFFNYQYFYTSTWYQGEEVNKRFKSTIRSWGLPHIVWQYYSKWKVKWSKKIIKAGYIIHR